MEGKSLTYKQFKDRNIPNFDKDPSQNSYLDNYDYNNKITLDGELLNEEYEKYKNYLMVKKECPACHFIQGMIFTGIGFVCMVRMHHFRETFNKIDFLKLFAIAAPSSAFGVYKFSYANYIFGVQSKMDQLNKFLEQ